MNGSGLDFEKPVVELERKIEELKKIETLEKESNKEATERISAELIAASKLNKRRDTVMNYFFEITDMPMPLAWFEEYNEIFNKAEPGYNIKDFIWEKQQAILEYNEFMKKDSIYDKLLDKEVNYDREERLGRCEEAG